MGSGKPSSLKTEIYDSILKDIIEDNLPVTTKHDKAYHGYGLRSIKNSVKKYNGVFQVKIKDGCFCLKILFPIKE